jgi:hypothetical protein
LPKQVRQVGEVDCQLRLIFGEQVRGFAPAGRFLK